MNPSFTSKEFSEFMAANGVQHVRSAPYHPATNGAARDLFRPLNKFFEQGGETKEVVTKVSSFSDDVQKYTTFHNWGNPS